MYKELGDTKTINAQISLENLQNLQTLHGDVAVKDALYMMFTNLQNEKYETV